eukprot:14576125-Ditylum_brightwellii.AAC.1
MENLDVWELIDKKDMPFTESGVKRTIIESTWAFKVKRTSDRTVKKRKAQLCVCGDQQVKDIDYFETFVPVVSWNMVRTVMILTVTLGLKSHQVDYTNALIQTTLNPSEEVYMALPRKWEQPGKVLKLRKSVYGLAQAPLAWFKYDGYVPLY